MDHAAVPEAESEDGAYRHVLAFTRAHYENFPVASVLLPRHLRRHVAAIYAFARTADDFADEAEFEGRRLELIDGHERKLRACAAGEPVTDPVFTALAATMRERRLPLEPFTDLLAAFRRDVVQPRHPTFEELLDYSRYSANPIGRLVLLLFDERDAETHRLSDLVTSALQLANFWQDVAIDYRKGRIYLPLEDMRHFGVAESDLALPTASAGVRALVQHLAGRTAGLFREGHPLVGRVGGRLALELRLTWWGGMAVLEKIAAQGYDTLSRRPVLGRRDWARLLLRTIARRPPPVDFPPGLQRAAS